jgi:Protein of unknown function (DUF2946)
MDDIVLRSMAKWPNVPHCYGWLGLDARGNWYMRDDRAQAAGPFSAARGGNWSSKGSRLQHDKLIAFIERNYAPDSSGQWYFQNGPQRVYVELEATPWVWRLQVDAHGQIAVTAHSGTPAQMQRCLLDETGHVYLVTDLGVGLIHSQDVDAAALAVEQNLWMPENILARNIPGRFGFVTSPQQRNAPAQG